MHWWDSLSLCCTWHVWTLTWCTCIKTAAISISRTSSLTSMNNQVGVQWEVIFCACYCYKRTLCFSVKTFVFNFLDKDIHFVFKCKVTKTFCKHLFVGKLSCNKDYSVNKSTEILSSTHFHYMECIQKIWPPNNKNL